MALHVKDLHFSFDKKEVFFDKLNLKVQNSVITALIGANGCGKTTLLKNIAGQLKPKSAEIFYENLDLMAMSGKEKAKTLSYMSQFSHNVEKITALDVILLGRKPYVKYAYTTKDYDLANKFISLLNLKAVLEKDFTSLSGGEKQRVMLAKSLMQEPKILLLDEPNNHLDPKNQIEALQLVQYVCKSLNIATIIVLHDINLALRFAKEVIMMRDREICYSLPVEKITKNHLEDIYNIEIDFIKKYNTVIFNPNNKKIFKVENEL